jgi:hypothetical protein
MIAMAMATENNKANESNGKVASKYWLANFRAN